jgi:ankyrin repeat protein
MGNTVSFLTNCLGEDGDTIDYYIDTRNEPLLPKTYQPHSFSHEAKQLAEACAKGEYDQVQIILSENTSIHINEADDLGLTALYNAALYGHIQICNLLLEMGADPNIANKNGEMPIHLACKSGDLQLCKLLIKFGANYNFRFRGRSCLDLAVQGNHIALVQYLLAVCPKMLLSMDDDVGSSSARNTLRKNEKSVPSAMIIAVSLNYFEIVKLLLEHLPDMQLLDMQTGKTCLMIACEKDYYKIVHFLLANNQKSLMETLEQRNDIEEGWTCIHYAAARNAQKSIEIIAKFFENHAIWNELKDNNGRTPLHLASLYGHFELVRLLLEYGARTDILDNDYKQPSDLASATLHYHQVIKVFKEYAQKNNPPAGPNMGLTSSQQKYATPMSRTQFSQSEVR